LSETKKDIEGTYNNQPRINTSELEQLSSEHKNVEYLGEISCKTGENFDSFAEKITKIIQEKVIKFS